MKNCSHRGRREQRQPQRATDIPTVDPFRLGDLLDRRVAPVSSIFCQRNAREMALTLAAKAYAFLRGRGYVTPQDVKSIGMDVLRHRVAITYEAEAEEKTSEIVIQKIFDELPVP